jgi:FKBP-type peptidyl-prolyl cis-trans isomerase
MSHFLKTSTTVFLLIGLLITYKACKKAEVPTLTTSVIANITGTSAISGGTIISEGTGPVIARGVCWSIANTPKIKDNKTSDGDSAGIFTSNISGLNDATTYYVRAYATNSFGTGYGEALSFTTLDPAKVEDEIIQEFINKNPTYSFQLKPSGLYYLDLIIGTGPVPVAHDTAYVQYTGMFLNGNVFDTNAGEADLIFEVAEGQLIPGFDEGITYMREGGKAVFLMPSKLAYGSAGYYIIPGYTPLLFEVYLVKVKKR